MDQEILRKWLDSGLVENRTLFPTKEGTPQGGIASPVLANMTLDGLETLLKQKYPPTWKTGQRPKVNMVRYADDFLVTARTRELLEEEVKPLIRSFLAERGLTLSEEKTRVTHVSEGFDFLGFHVRKQSGRLMITPAQKSVKRFWEQVSETVRQGSGNATHHLIIRLNELRGWGNYYRSCSSSSTFRKTDNYVFWCLWRWARRCHPNKSATWIKAKYFPATNRREWQFTATDNRGRRQDLFCLMSLTYRRHTLIQGEANPFDPEWEDYFEQRHTRESQGIRAANHVKRLLTRQLGGCSCCGERLLSSQTWKIRPLRSEEGDTDSTLDNGTLVHQECYAPTQRH